MQITEFWDQATLVTSKRHISGSKMSTYKWSSLHESRTHPLKNRHFPPRAPNHTLGHKFWKVHIMQRILHIYGLLKKSEWCTFGLISINMQTMFLWNYNIVLLKKYLNFMALSAPTRQINAWWTRAFKINNNGGSKLQGLNPCSNCHLTVVIVLSVLTLF